MYTIETDDQIILAVLHCSYQEALQAAATWTELFGEQCWAMKVGA